MQLKNKVTTALIIAVVATNVVTNLQDLATIPTSADTVKTVINTVKMMKTKQYYYHDLNAELMIRSAEVINSNQLYERYKQRDITSIDLDDFNYRYTNNSKTATIITVDIKNKNDDAVLLQNTDFAIRDTNNNVYQAKNPDRLNKYVVTRQNGYDKALELYFDIPDDAILKDLIIKNPIVKNTDILPYNFDLTSFNSNQKEIVYKNQIRQTIIESTIYSALIVLANIIFTKIKIKNLKKRGTKKCLK